MWKFLTHTHTYTCMIFSYRYYLSLINIYLISKEPRMFKHHKKSKLINSIKFKPTRHNIIYDTKRKHDYLSKKVKINRQLSKTINLDIYSTLINNLWKMLEANERYGRLLQVQSSTRSFNQNQERFKLLKASLRKISASTLAYRAKVFAVPRLDGRASSSLFIYAQILSNRAARSAYETKPSSNRVYVMYTTKQGGRGLPPAPSSPSPPSLPPSLCRWQMARESLGSISLAHARENQYFCGIHSRPVYRVYRNYLAALGSARTISVRFCGKGLNPRAAS